MSLSPVSARDLACEEDDYEVGFEKVALFADGSGEPTHAARQVSETGWTSKVGRLHDIRHPLRALEGEAYGRVVRIMKRSLPTSR